MCLFTHFAAGALAGGATGNVWAGAIAGVASHAVLDVIPHYDHPDWRIELGGGILALVILLMMPFSSAAAVVGGLFGMAPDLENLFQKLGKMKRSSFIFPTHTGLLPHGRELGPRSLVWQVTIFIGCFLALGLVAPGDAQAATLDGQAEMGRPVVRLVSQGQDRSVVRVTFPVVNHPDDWRSVTPDMVTWGLPMEVDPALVEGPAVLPPHVPVSLAVPTRRPVETRVLDVLWWREPDTTPDLVAETAFADPSTYRSVPMTGAVVPVSAAGGVLREITLEILHPADGAPRRQLGLAGAVDPYDNRGGITVPDGVLNADLYRALATGGVEASRDDVRRDKAAEFDPFSLTSHWVKLEVIETGVFRFTGQDLLNYGVATGDVDPAKLRIYRGGGRHLVADPEVPDTLQVDRAFLNEIPIEVTGGDDGEWNLDDEVRFYGFGSSAWLDRFDPGQVYDEFYDHPYSDRAIYWLTWETDSTPSPLPGSPWRVAVTAAPPLGGAAVDFGRSRVHVEQQNFSEAGLVEDNWTWDNAVISSLPTQTFNLRKVVPDSAADFTMDLRGKWYSLFDRHTYQMSGWINDDEANAGTLDFDRSTQETQRRMTLEGRSAVLAAGINTFRLRNDSSHSKPASFDCFDIYYWALLDISSGGTLEFLHPADQVPAPGTAIDFRITAGAGETPVLWDVSDAAGAAAFTGQDLGGDVHAFGFLRNQVDRQFVVVGEDDFLSPLNGRRVSPVSLRASVPDVDYVVVYAPIFSGPAADLAQYRSMELPGVANPAAVPVSAGDIYDNFSGGQKDPLAIRNYLRRIYTDGGMRLRYACLLGNASRDFRNYKGQDPNLDLYDHLPTVLRTDFPITPVPLTSRLAYSSDDGLSSFDTAPTGDLDVPDIGTGRLPASNVTEAQDLVDRAIAYADDPDPGSWRNEVIFVADDCVTFSSWPTPIQGEQAHTLHAEDLAGLYLPEALDLQKIYGVAYDFPPSSRVKPDMRSDINEALGRGATMFYYVGHGAEDNLADEQIFQSTDIPNLGNGMKRPLFNAFSCDVGVFDNPSHHSMAEKFILEEDGGAIGSICASQVSFAHSNRALANAFYGSLFPGRRIDPGIGVSEALAMGKSLMTSRDYRKNSQRYNLLSDPALSLPHPVDDLEFSAASDDTMYAGHLMTARLDASGGKALLTPGDRYELLAEESGYDFGYIYAYRDSATGDPLNPFIDVPRWDTFPHRGSNVFLGNGTVGTGDLEIPFMVPAQLRYGDVARLRLITTGMVGENSAFRHLSAERAELGANDDVLGPRIDLAFENNTFTVRPGTPLNAVLDDTSGIAILGTTPGNSLLLEFDESGFMTDVTTSFTYDANSYTQGRLSIPLPGDLALGKHTAALHGADALGNVGSDTLSFEVAPAGVTGIERITLFPNPTPGPCRLIFELSDPMEVQWEIYTTAGRRLKTMRRNFPQAGPRILEWDGRDDAGDEIANGTYLYVLRGLGGAEEGRDITSTGKLVIMR